VKVSTLHRHVMDDVEVMRDSFLALLPVQMPNQYRNRQMNVTSFVDRLNRTTEPFNVFNEINEDFTIPVGDMTCSGLWLGEEDLPENNSDADIRILWHVHPDSRRVSVTPTKWTRRRYFFWSILMHELVHRYQDGNANVRTYAPQSEDRKIKEDQSYYGNEEEIEAYAHDAALEFRLWWPELTVQQALRKASLVVGPTSPSACFYLNAYADVPEHPAMKLFERKLEIWSKEMTKHAAFYDTLMLPKLCT
jgi:hypothetical protein